jgi:superfamily II DNA or RNA helicase
MAPLIPKIKALVVDEVERMMSKIPKKFYNKMTSCSMWVGVSATPFKWDGKDKCQKFEVKGYFGPVMRTSSEHANAEGILTTESLQKSGILSKSKCTFYIIKNPPLPYEIYQDTVTKGIVQNLELHNPTKKLISQLSGRTLILVERLDHGDILANMIPGSIWVQGKDDEKTRKQVIEKLKHSKEDIVGIATSGIFSAGVSFFIHNLVNCSGGKAAHAVIQRMGRGLRAADDKERLNYYDWMFLINSYLEDHSKQRIKILKKEGHDVEVKEIDF